MKAYADDVTRSWSPQSNYVKTALMPAKNRPKTGAIILPQEQMGMVFLIGAIAVDVRKTVHRLTLTFAAWTGTPSTFDMG